MSELLTFLNLRYDYVAHTLEVTNQAKDARVDTLNQVKLENRLQEKAAYVRTRADMYARVEHYTTQQHIYIKDHFTPIHTVVSFSQTNLTQFYQKLAHLQTNSPSLMSYALDQAKRNQLKVAASLLIEFMNVPPDEVLFHTSTLNTPHQRTETRVGKKHIADELIWEQQITAHKLQQSHQAHILAPQTYEDNRKVGKDREAIYWTLTEQMNAFEFAMKQLMHHHESHNKARQASHITQAEAFAAEWAMVTDADEACGTNNSFEETRPLLHRHKQALPKHLYMTLEPASQEALPVKSLASAKTTLPKKEHKF
jgi:hypothetical protein